MEEQWHDQVREEAPDVVLLNLAWDGAGVPVAEWFLVPVIRSLSQRLGTGRSSTWPGHSLSLIVTNSE